jgi:hypothetical protein
MERLDIWKIPVPKPMKISTSSTTMTIGFVHNKIKDGISAPTHKEVMVTLTSHLNVRVIKVTVTLSLKILFIAKVE